METIEKRRIPSPTYGITSCFSIVSAMARNTPSFLHGATLKIVREWVRSFEMLVVTFRKESLKDFVLMSFLI